MANKHNNYFERKNRERSDINNDSKNEIISANIDEQFAALVNRKMFNVLADTIMERLTPKLTSVAEKIINQNIQEFETLFDNIANELDKKKVEKKPVNESESAPENNIDEKQELFNELIKLEAAFEKLNIGKFEQSDIQTLIDLEKKRNIK